MTIIRDLFDEKTGDSAVVGDYIIAPYKSGIHLVSFVGPYINRAFYSKHCRVIPKEIADEVISDEVVDLIESKFNAKDALWQLSKKEELNFIKTYKIYSQDLYELYNKVKSVEFIPKTGDHLKCLFNALYGRTYKVG